uniref:Mitochondrial import inner membrane translocase subunit n=1 Tax=Heterorhabditis bacteriophora TaxID=37862 RepID=A0A1I7X0D1_HETBA
MATEQQMQMVAELEVEMMSDMYRRMTGACQEKCISKAFKEGELTKVSYNGDSCQILNLLTISVVVKYFLNNSFLVISTRRFELVENTDLSFIQDY